jgi:hypothetical protein
MTSRTRSACAFVELAGKSKQDRFATYPQVPGAVATLSRGQSIKAGQSPAGQTEGLMNR